MTAPHLNFSTVGNISAPSSAHEWSFVLHTRMASTEAHRGQLVVWAALVIRGVKRACGLVCQWIWKALSGPVNKRPDPVSADEFRRGLNEKYLPEVDLHWRVRKTLEAAFVQDRYARELVPRALDVLFLQCFKAHVSTYELASLV